MPERLGTSSELTLLHTRFAQHTPASALNAAAALLERDAPAWIALQNVHGVNLADTDPSYRAVIASADLVLNDGKGVLLGARLLGRPFPEDLNGNFFTPLLVERAAERGWRVFLLGAKPGVAERAATQMRSRHPDLSISGCHHGYLSDPVVEGAAIQQIRSSGTDLLLVGMGNPHQERWLHRNLVATGARLGIGVGAHFDFVAGEVPRAPAWMNRLGIEWLHRLAMEPRRLWRRYLIGNPRFLWKLLRTRLRDRR